jgi:hypothetical protein
MSLKEFTCRIGLISWSITSKYPFEKYIVLGEIYDKDIINNIGILREFNYNLQFLYPFKVKKTGDKIKVYNEQDFSYFRKKYKLTETITLKNYKECEKIVFRTPCLYDISCMEKLLPNCFNLYKYPEKKSSHCRVFIVLPCDNPITRGNILKECLLMGKNNGVIFLLVGNKYGLNNDTTSTLMKRYLLRSGVESNDITKSVFDKFPDLIKESLDILPLILGTNNYLSHDIFISCESSIINKVMSFVRDKKLLKCQFICD